MEDLENSADNSEGPSLDLLCPSQTFPSLWGGSRGKESGQLLLKFCSHSLENNSVFPCPEKWQGGMLEFHTLFRSPYFKDPESRHE